MHDHNSYMYSWFRNIGNKRYFINILLFIFFIWSCTNNTVSTPEPNESRQSIIRLGAATGIKLLSGNSSLESIQASEQNSRASKAALADGIVVHQILDYNLDDDDDIEQLISVKKQGDSNDLIHLLLVDRPSDAQGWVVTWETSTLASNISTFDVRIIDVLGRHQQTIVAHGLTKDAQQTISLFHCRKTPSGLVADTLFQMSANNEVSLGTVSRTAAYEESLAAGEPYPVYVVENQTLDGKTEIIRNTYNWNQELRRFAITKTERVPSQALETAQLQELFRKRIQDLEISIDGAWIKTKSSQQLVVFFDSASKNVRVMEGKLLEGHDWNNTVKTNQSGRLSIFLSNEAFKSLKTIINLTFIDLNNIYLSFKDRPEWEGNYQRLNEQGGVKIQKNARSRISVFPFSPKGAFKGQDDSELIFNDLHITRRRGNTRETGTFVTFDAGQAIITLAFMNEQGLIDKVENYKYKLTEPKSGETSPLLLALSPVILQIDTIIDIPGETILYTKIVD
jgi:hypothetical protein